MHKAGALQHGPCFFKRHVLHAVKDRIRNFRAAVGETFAFPFWCVLNDVVAGKEALLRQGNRGDRGSNRDQHDGLEQRASQAISKSTSEGFLHLVPLLPTIMHSLQTMWSREFAPALRPLRSSLHLCPVYLTP